MLVFRLSKIIASVLLLSSYIYTLKAQSDELAQAPQQTSHPTFANVSVEMVAIPSGSFLMNNEPVPLNKASNYPIEVAAFALSKTEVTFAQWDACFRSGACSYRPNDQGWGRDNRPVINVSYNDITQEFIPWLSKVDGIDYRLPTDAEWQYAAKTGSTTNHITSHELKCPQVQNKHYCMLADKTLAVASYQPNAMGLYDLYGNVLELTQDCWPSDHTISNNQNLQENDCDKHILRGGHWRDITKALNISYQGDWAESEQRSKFIGFRLAHDINRFQELEVGQTLEFLLASEGDPDEVIQALPDGEHFSSYYYHQSNTSYIINTETGYICAISIGKHNGVCSPF